MGMLANQSQIHQTCNRPTDASPETRALKRLACSTIGLTLALERLPLQSRQLLPQDLQVGRFHTQARV